MKYLLFHQLRYRKLRWSGQINSESRKILFLIAGPHHLKRYEVPATKVHNVSEEKGAGEGLVLMAKKK